MGVTLVLSVTTCMFWVGCSSEQMQNVTGSTPVNAFSIIQGLVTGGSIVSSSRHQVSFSMSSAVSESSSESFVVEENSDQFVGPQKRISLVTEEGRLIQQGVFDRYTSDGKLHYRFVGDFPKESLRLRIIELESVFEVAMGSLPETVDIIEIPEFDMVEAALATRMLEQTSEYEVLKKKDIIQFSESLDLLIKNRVKARHDKSLLAENINRVGINSEGNFEIYSTNYNPRIHRNPMNAQVWENDLFSTEVSFDSMDTTLETSDQVIQMRPESIRKRLVNWITHATVSDHSNRELILFQKKDLSDRSPTFLNQTEITLKIFFKEVLPIEFRESLLKQARLTVEFSRKRRDLNLADLNPKFHLDNVLELQLNLKSFAFQSNQFFALFLHYTFPELRPDEISQGFMRATFKLNS